MPGSKTAISLTGGTVTVFAIQTVRFQRPDFKIGLALEKGADPDQLTKSQDLAEAFVYAKANEFTVLPAWVKQTNTFEHFAKHGLIKAYDKPPSADKSDIELRAAIAEANLAQQQGSGSDPGAAGNGKQTKDPKVTTQIGAQG